MLFYQNLVATALVIGLFAIIRDRPSKPPSLVALKEPDEPRFFQNLKIALKNRDYVLLLVVFTMIDGVFVLFGVVIDPYLEGLGYTTTDASIVGGLVVLIGVIACIVSGLLLDKYPKYLLFTRMICFGSFVGMCGAYAIFPFTNVPMMYGFGCMVGIFLVPILPVGAAFVAELTFPLPEGITIGLMHMVAQVGSIPLGTLTSFYFSNQMHAKNDHQRTLICNA